MERIEDLIDRKLEIILYYGAHLSDLPITMNPIDDERFPGFWMPTVVVNEGVNFKREWIMEAFEKENIDGRVFFWPLSMLPMFRENWRSGIMAKSRFPVAYSIYPRAFNLPSYHDITEEEMDRVIKAVKEVIG
jgi:perosamine synthetase